MIKFHYDDRPCEKKEHSSCFGLPRKDILDIFYMPFDYVKAFGKSSIKSDES